MPSTVSIARTAAILALVAVIAWSVASAVPPHGAAVEAPDHLSGPDYLASTPRVLAAIAMLGLAAAILGVLHWERTDD